jgi:hypothetical protein
MKLNPRRGYNVVATRSKRWLETLRRGGGLNERQAA